MVEVGETQALTLTQEMVDEVVVNFSHTYGGETNNMEVYAGTSLSEDGMSLINDGSGDINYYSVNEDGRFYEIPLEYAIAQSPGEGSALADQIEASGFNYDQISADSKSFLAESADVHDHAGMLEFLRTTDNSHPVVMGLMGEESFVQTVGNYALNEGIQAELDKGQVFANDPRLDELNGISSNDFIAQQQEAIDALVTSRDGLMTNLENAQDGWLSNYYSNRINDLDAQITDMKVQLNTYKNAISELDDANAAIETLESQDQTGTIKAELESQAASAAALEAKLERIESGEYTIEEQIDDTLLEQSGMIEALALINADGMEQSEFIETMTYVTENRFGGEVPEEVMLALQEKFEESGGTIIAESEAPQPAPDQAQLYVDANPELKSYLEGLSEQTNIPEADLKAELEARGVPGDQIDRVMEIADTQMGVNITPRESTPVVTNGTLSANKAAGDPAAGIFNEAANQPASDINAPAPSPQSPSPEEIEIAARAEASAPKSSPMTLGT